MKSKKSVCAAVGLTAFGAVLAGCGGGGNASAGQSASVTLPDGLTLTLTEDKSRAAVGEKVTFRSRLRNDTGAPISTTYEGYGTPSSSSAGNSPLLQYINVADTAGMGVGEDGLLYFPPPLPPPHDEHITLQPGQAFVVTQTYTFRRADTYAATTFLLKPATPTSGGNQPTVAAGPLRVVVP